MGEPAGAAGGTVTEYLFKILVIGEPGVGKSSLVRMFVHGQFTATYKVRPAPHRAAL